MYVYVVVAAAVSIASKSILCAVIHDLCPMTSNTLYSIAMTMTQSELNTEMSIPVFKISFLMLLSS